MSTTRYPIAEIFDSVQGEGRFTGTAMTFLRLAGCCVGRPAAAARALPPGREVCTGWDGRQFDCDTDYRRVFSMSLREIAEHELIRGAQRVCITGGEPLIHDLTQIVAELQALSIGVHIETSGVRQIDPELRNRNHPDPLWLTVSPKHRYLESMLMMADEIKILVDDDFQEEWFVRSFEAHFSKIYVQPVNGMTDVSSAHLEVCMKLRERWRLAGVSVQLHKILGVR